MHIIKKQILQDEVKAQTTLREFHSHVKILTLCLEHRLSHKHTARCLTQQ